MRNKAVVLVIGIMAVHSTAVTAAEKSTEDSCADLHKLAKEVMDARQTGMDMPVIMDIVKENELAKSIVRDAYKAPQYSTEEMQQREISDFANSIYSQCLDAFDSQKNK